MSQTNVSAALVGAIPAINKSLSITNSSSAEVAVLNLSGSDDPSQSGYGQPLIQLNTTSGQSAIPANGSGNVVLDGSHAVNGNSVYTRVYNIIFAKASNLFPVKSVSSALSFKTQAFNPVSITDDDAAAMNQTEQFLQAITAYPTSQLAQNYAAAMQNIQNNATDDTDAEASVVQFFASTNFKLVSIASISAVSSYYKRYPYVWASYQPSKTYYLYSSDGNKVTYLGSVSINIAAATTVDPNLPGFSFTYTDPSKAVTPLYFRNGQFVDDKNSASPAICLTGTFVLKSTLTQVATDNMIVPVLVGMVKGIKVAGYDTQAIPNSDGSGYTNPPASDAGGSMSVMEILGIVVLSAIGLWAGFTGVEWLVEQIKDFKESIKELTGSDTPDYTEHIKYNTIEEWRDGVQTDMIPVREELQKQLDNTGVEDELLPDPVEFLKSIEPKLKELHEEVQKVEMENEGEIINEVLSDELDAGVNSTKLQNDVDKIEDSLEKIDQATPENIEQVLDAEQTPLDQVKVDVDASYAKAVTEAEGQAETELKEADKELKDMEAEEANLEKEKEEEETGETEDTEFTKNEAEG